jgi:hypothetical protein
MKTNIFVLILIFAGCLTAILLSSIALHAQNISIAKYDLSTLWKGDTIHSDDDIAGAFPEPLGFIGDNYQRFYIHYTSVVKTGPDLYTVKGKTRVKDNICNFTGTIKVLKAVMHKDSEDPGYKEGTLTCQVTLYEDSTQRSSGFIKGQLTTDFCIDAKGHLQYDALTLGADGYANNQCEATWTSYSTKKSKKCNWGDYRIPDSGDLDTGVGEFMITEKYIPNGWENYTKLNSDDEQTATKAKEIESKEWWK